MNASEALGRLKRLRVPAATTADAAAVLGLSGEAASHTLRRLARSGLVTPLRKGLWALADRSDPLARAQRAHRDGARDVQRASRAACLLRWVRVAAGLGHQARGAREGAGRLSLPLADARPAVHRASRARVSARSEEHTSE